MFEARKDESFSEREERVLRLWKEQKIFEKSVESREGKELFSFYDGPPFATGLPHYGHLLAGTIKDVIPRYKTMKGYFVPRRFGWDCHGLPVENEIEKAKELSGAPSIEAFGIDKFNEECRSIVLRYTEEWKSTVERMGRWVDFTNTYKTMDKTFMESVWWVFKQLCDKGLVYEGFKVMPFSAQLGTPLSNFEANLNYQEVDDPSLTILFKNEEEDNCYFLAWTTTPWTLVSNLALIVGPEINYVKILENKTGRKLILAKERLSHLFKEKESYSIIEEFTGDKLQGLSYKPLFSYFSDKKEEGAFRVLTDEFVSTEDGTGIVHAAPAFGEVDFFVCKREGIEIVCPVDNNGRFTKEIPEYSGTLVKDADKEIIRRLKDEGKVFHHGQIRHRYPFCWRSDTPLIYKAVGTWFVAVEKIKQKLLDANSQIHWTPEHIKGGRFGKWLMNARDWAISRNRYWGTPIPIWRNEEGDIHIIGSVEELEERTGKKIEDLHRHFIDDITFEIEGKTYKRIPEVFDCWFESGSMPYAQNHYPFENKERVEEGFPADFIAEGLDQTRGWFYTLTVLAAALFDKPAFKNVIVNGIILAEDGNKMSKRLKNYPEPGLVINKYGADAVRLYMLHSPAVRADDLRFSERDVEVVLRQNLIPFYNSFLFFTTYAKIYAWDPSELIQQPENLIDRWILSCMQRLIHEVETGLDNYDLNRSVEPFVGFIDQLTNWYIRRSRARFWAAEDTQDRREAFSTLYQVLLNLSKITAPFIPFISDAIYQELKMEKDPESVHLCDYPAYNEALRDYKLEEEMEYAQRAVRIGHSLRKEHKIKVRQPLSRAHIAVSDKKLLSLLERQKHLIQDELNVKEIDFHESDDQFVSYQIVPNFRVLGKKVGKLMPQVQKRLQSCEKKEINHLMRGDDITLHIDGKELQLTPEDLTISRKVKEGVLAGNDEEVVLALETHLTPQLLLEGLAREIVNKVNMMRREMQLDVTDRIELFLDTTERVQSCMEQFGDFITGEVLATKVHFEKNDGTLWDLNGERCVMDLKKA